MSVIMTIGAHVGDMELTAGGVIATEYLKGNRTVMVSLTAGEKGAPSDISVSDYRKQKVSEAEAFAAEFDGVAIVMDEEDGRLEETDGIVWRLVDLIRLYKPDVIITHWKNSIHKDHATASRIAEHARYFAGNGGFERENPPHPCPRMFFAENLEDKDGFSPFLYVDISAGYEKWISAVRKMEFVTKSKDHRYLDYYAALSTVRGCESNCDKAEAFMVREMFSHVETHSILDFWR